MSMKAFRIKDGIVQIHVNVGISSVSSSNIIINFHFLNQNGDEWSVSHLYSSLKLLDSRMSSSCNLFKHIAFPLIDSKFMKKLSKAYEETKTSSPSSLNNLNFCILTEEYRKSFENWTHCLIHRQHSLHEELRFRIIILFLLPAGEAPDGISIYNTSKVNRDPGVFLINNNVNTPPTSTATKSQSNTNSKGNKQVSMTTNTVVPNNSNKNLNKLISLSALKQSLGMTSSSRLTQEAVESNVQKYADEQEKEPYLPHYTKEDTVKMENDRRVNTLLQQELRLEQSMVLKNSLLQVAVNRGREGARDKIEYEVKIESLTKSKNSKNGEILFRTSKRYSIFRMLWQDLANLNIINIDRLSKGTASGASPEGGRLLSTELSVTGFRQSDAVVVGLSTSAKGADSSITNVPSSSVKKSSCQYPVIYILNHFPLPPWKCNLGIALNETDLSYRARLLDLWLREVLYLYSIMPSPARIAVRRFLGLNMQQQQDINIQDSLVRGLIAAPRQDLPLFILRSGLESLGVSTVDTSQQDSAEKKSNASGTVHSRGNNSNVGAKSNSSSVRKVMLTAGTKSRYGSLDGSEYESQTGSDEDEAIVDTALGDDDFVPAPMSVLTFARQTPSISTVYNISAIYFKYFVVNARWKGKYPVLETKPGPKNALELDQHVWEAVFAKFSMTHQLPAQAGLYSRQKSFVDASFADRITESLMEEDDDDDDEHGPGEGAGGAVGFMFGDNFFGGARPTTVSNTVSNGNSTGNNITRGDMKTEVNVSVDPDAYMNIGMAGMDAMGGGRKTNIMSKLIERFS